MGTQRAPEAVKSHEANLAVVLFIIETDEYTLHKAHVRVEVVGSALARVEIRSGAREYHIRRGYHTLEVGDGGGIVASGGACYVIRVNRAGKEEVYPGRTGDVRDGPWWGLARVVVVSFRPGGSDF
jgi:hypothetical protein